MQTFDPKKIATKDLHQHLLGAVAPRPIAFASTVDKNGIPNIAPYSFFNAFSSNPPILVFSSNRRVSDNTTKDTLHNIQETGEVVINVVNYAIVRQMAVASIQFDTGISEFVKSGLTPIPSEEVKPFRIKESPAQLECKVREIVTLGETGGAGHLIICEVVKLHFHDDVIENGRINPHKMDLMGRMGRAYYVRASGAAIHTIIQSVTEVSIGFDQLPDHIKNSKILTGNNLGQLAGMVKLPEEAEVLAIKNEVEVIECLESEHPTESLHELAKLILDEKDDRAYAAKVLLLEKLL